MPILEDKLIEGTSTYKGHFHPSVHKQGAVVPRIYPCTVMQGGTAFLDGFVFIGTPVKESALQRIRQENNLSKNYGAVLLPKNLLENIDSESSKLIVGEVDDSYVIAGLLPSETLRRDLRRVTSDEEAIVYTSMKEFPTLNPQELIDKWAN